VADDFDLGEFSHRQFPAHINAAVNVRRIRFAARHEVNAFHLRRVLVGLADEAVFPGTDIRTLQLFRVRLPPVI